MKIVFGQGLGIGSDWVNSTQLGSRVPCCCRAPRGGAGVRRERDGHRDPPVKIVVDRGLGPTQLKIALIPGLNSRPHHCRSKETSGRVSITSTNHAVVFPS